ncbi:MAG: septum formation initiator family protein [Bacteroidota bacterium]
MKNIFKFIKNKYAITFLTLLVWILFFDRYDLFSQLEQRKELKKLETDRDYYISEIEKNSKDLNELQTNPVTLEKYAREKYLMKKDDEEIFVIIDKTKI